VHTRLVRVSRRNFFIPLEGELYEAVKNQDINSVRELIAMGVDVNRHPGPYDRTALRLAAVRRNSEIVELLLNHGAHVEATDNDRLTALHLAIKVIRNILTVQLLLLLERGTDVGATQRGGRTPLHVAVRSVDSAIVLLLLEYSSPVDGLALHLAITGEIRQLLEVNSKGLSGTYCKTRQRSDPCWYGFTGTQCHRVTN